MSNVKRVIFAEFFYPMEHMPLAAGNVIDPASVDTRVAVSMIPIGSVGALREFLAENVLPDTEVVSYVMNEMTFVLMREASGLTQLTHSNGGLWNGVTPKTWRMEPGTVVVLFNIGRRTVGDKGSVPVVTGLTLVR